MGIALTVYHLVRFEGIDVECRHHLLLRVTQPAFGNWSENQYREAAGEQERRRDRLVADDQAGRLARSCAHRHRVVFEGELHGLPAGDALDAATGPVDLEIWVAETRFGAPWIVLGTAPSEHVFWRLVSEEDDLTALDPKRPARLVPVHFVMASD